MKKLEVDNEIIEVVPKVCYLVDIFLLVVNMAHLSKLVVTISFRQILPIAYPLHQHFLLLLTNGKMNLITRIMLNVACRAQQWSDC